MSALNYISALVFLAGMWLGSILHSISSVRRLRVLLFLRAHTGYHYGRDIAKATYVPRSVVYWHLAALEDLGLVEMTGELGADSEWPHQYTGQLVRPRWRFALPATVKRAAK